MRAILINRDGFRKCIEVARITPIISFPDGLNTVSIYEFGSPEAIDTKLDIREFRFVREYEDEFDNHILIYREMP